MRGCSVYKLSISSWKTDWLRIVLVCSIYYCISLRVYVNKRCLKNIEALFSTGFPCFTAAYHTFPKFKCCFYAMLCAVVAETNMISGFKHSWFSYLDFNTKKQLIPLPRENTINHQVQPTQTNRHGRRRSRNISQMIGCHWHLSVTKPSCYGTSFDKRLYYFDINLFTHLSIL